MKMKWIGFAISWFSGVTALAHGGGMPEKAEPKKQGSPARIAPKRPVQMNGSSLADIVASADVPPSDVLLVRCQIGQFAPCRGFEVELLDEHGDTEVTGHTGATGMLGFEGLRSDEFYKVRLKHVRYSAEVSLKPGGGALLSAESRLE